jgi:hypothetical protein
MKRYGNLYPYIVDPDNIRRAHENAQKGKRHYTEVKRVNRHQDAYLDHLQRMLVERRYRTSEYKVKRRNDTGKERIIYVLPYYPDRIVHHAVMQVLEPIWERTLIRDTYSAIKGRGIHDGVRRVKRMLRDEPGSRYCLKMDVKQFYPSIDNHILKRILRQKIKCRPTLELLDEIVDSAPGVPIGNYLSQYFGNLYLSPFDHWVKEVLGGRYYARYCDDLILFGASKAWLHQARKRVRDYLWQRLALELKTNWQIFPTAVRGVDFLGYRFFGYKTKVRKSIAKRYKRRMRRVARESWPHCPSVVMSYSGWLAYANAKGLWQQHVTLDVVNNVALACRAQGQTNPLEGKT